MPIIKSAKKRVAQAQKRQHANYNRRRAFRKSMRRVSDAVKTGDKATAEKELIVAYKTIDMATKNNVLHQNTAARRKSLLAKMVAGTKAKKATAKKTAPKKALPKQAEAPVAEEAKAE